MREALATNPAATRLMADRSPPLSSICREVGLAAFAAELHLRASELELDAAVAVERGAAALFLAGFLAPTDHFIAARPNWKTKTGA